VSYDLEIRSDDNYSQSVAYAKLSKFVAKLPQVSKGAFQDQQKDLFMNIDLEFVSTDDPEVSVSAREKGVVNVVRLHIPYSKLHDTNDDMIYFDVAEKIASHLGWKIWDCQQGCYT
jgi:hypothetical protein